MTFLFSNIYLYLIYYYNIMIIYIFYTLYTQTHPYSSSKFTGIVACSTRIFSLSRFFPHIHSVCTQPNSRRSPPPFTRHGVREKTGQRAHQSFPRSPRPLWMRFATRGPTCNTKP